MSRASAGRATRGAPAYCLIGTTEDGGRDRENFENMVTPVAAGEKGMSSLKDDPEWLMDSNQR